jgi:hypothetical protein
MAVEYLPALRPRLPDPADIDLKDPEVLRTYLRQLNQSLAAALARTPQSTTPRVEYLLISPNGTIRALRLKDDGTSELVIPGKVPGA